MQTSDYSRLSALVIDDFDNFRTTLFRLLQDFGIKQVAMAHNGEDAIRMCQSHNFDLVLCDYNLGNGKNGQQVLEELRIKKLLPSGSVFLLISAETSKSIVMSAYDYEPDAYLTKPITAKALQQRIARILAQRVEMADCYRALDANRYDDAIAIAEAAVAQGSRCSGDYHKILGQIYLRQHNLGAAETLFRQVLETRPVDWAQLGLAQVQHARGNTDTAIKWLKSIIAKNPFCMRAYDDLARLYGEQGHTVEQQKVLATAVEISPMSIGRQCALGQVADLNNDLETAARAFSRTVKLGRNSCLDAADNHLAFVRAAARLHGADETAAGDYVREVQRSLAECERRFIVSADTQLQLRLLECQTQACFGDKARARTLLHDLRGEIDNMEVAPSLDARLDMVVALTANGDKAAAKTLLDDLVREFDGDEASLCKIDRLLNEPVSESNRARVAAINSHGIQAYKNGEFKEAVEHFEEAQRLFPNHPGVQLNLVQAFLGAMKKFGKNDERMAQCRLLLDQVRLVVNTVHPHYERYERLDQLWRQLSRDKE